MEITQGMAAAHARRRSRYVQTAQRVRRDPARLPSTIVRRRGPVRRLELPELPPSTLALEAELRRLDRELTATRSRPARRLLAIKRRRIVIAIDTAC